METTTTWWFQSSKAKKDFNWKVGIEIQISNPAHFDIRATLGISNSIITSIRVVVVIHILY